MDAASKVPQSYAIPPSSLELKFGAAPAKPAPKAAARKPAAAPKPAPKPAPKAAPKPAAKPAGGARLGSVRVK